MWYGSSGTDGCSDVVGYGLKLVKRARAKRVHFVFAMNVHVLFQLSIDTKRKQTIYVVGAESAIRLYVWISSYVRRARGQFTPIKQGQRRVERVPCSELSLNVLLHCARERDVVVVGGLLGGSVVLSVGVSRLLF